MEEQDLQLWTGSPSHINNLGIYILCFLGCWLVLPVFFAFYKFLDTHYTRYNISGERIFIRTGIFNRRLEEVELYRVKDYSIQKPFFLRIFYLASLTMNTSDNTRPVLVLEAIPDSEVVRNIIRKRVEYLRTIKNIREVDFNG